MEDLTIISNLKGRDSIQYGPNPDAIYSNEAIKSACFVKNAITRPSILVGGYTHYDDIHGPERFEEHVTHHYEFLSDKPTIGKFCTIVEGIELVIDGADHRMCSVTAYPSNIMGSGWERFMPSLDDLFFKGDTIVGNDVWIGQNITVTPGIHIGDGATITANSVVAKSIPAYCIAGGNSRKATGKRFDGDLTEYLLQLQWQNWLAEKAFEHPDILRSADSERIWTIEKQ